MVILILTNTKEISTYSALSGARFTPCERTVPREDYLAQILFAKEGERRYQALRRCGNSASTPSRSKLEAQSTNSKHKFKTITPCGKWRQGTEDGCWDNWTGQKLRGRLEEKQVWATIVVTTNYTKGQ